MTARRGPAAWASATLGLAVAMMLPALVAIPAAGVAQPVTAQAVAVDVSTTTTPLTNLAHLDFLGDTVSPPEQAGHTTYRLADSPKLGVLWTYANLGADGVYERVGGGAYAAATNTWGQGAFNADDLSRAAVVYLRHWQLTGNGVSREHAYQLLRALTYMQTATGDNAGNVVLWMQPDGTLNPSAEPVERPDPVGLPGVAGVGQLDRFGARVERAVRLHPEDDVAGVVAGCCLHVGERAQQLVRVLAADAVPGELPVAQVDNGRPAEVVRVEGALAPGVRGGGVRAATDPCVRPAGTEVGVGPDHAELGGVGEPVRGVTGLLRRRHRVTEEVQVGQVRQRRRRRAHIDGYRLCGHRLRDAGGRDRHQGGEHHRRGESQPVSYTHLTLPTKRIV